MANGEEEFITKARLYNFIHEVSSNGWREVAEKLNATKPENDWVYLENDDAFPRSEYTRVLDFAWRFLATTGEIRTEEMWNYLLKN